MNILCTVEFRDTLRAYFLNVLNKIPQFGGHLIHYSTMCTGTQVSLYYSSPISQFKGL